MLEHSMTFDEWAQDIQIRVADAVPNATVNDKLEDICRWVRAGKECQVHALSDSVATFVALRRNGIITDCSFSCRISITQNSQAEVASRIIGWLGTPS